MKKYIFISLGFICVVVGFINIVIPGLPTTPLLLLAAYLFSKSSPTLHQRLLNNRVLGPYINKLSKGFNLKTLFMSMSIMWAMIIISMFTTFNANIKMQVVMLSLGFIGSISQVVVYLKKKKQQINAIKS